MKLVQQEASQGPRPPSEVMLQGDADDAASVVSEARTPSKSLVLGSRSDVDLRSSNAALQQEVTQYRLALAALQCQQDSVDSRSTVAETTKDVTNKVAAYGNSSPDFSNHGPVAHCDLQNHIDVQLQLETFSVWAERQELMNLRVPISSPEPLHQRRAAQKAA